MHILAVLSQTSLSTITIIWCTPTNERLALDCQLVSLMEKMKKLFCINIKHDRDETFCYRASNLIKALSDINNSGHV